jgi:hypothetical protein
MVGGSMEERNSGLVSNHERQFILRLFQFLNAYSLTHMLISLSLQLYGHSLPRPDLSQTGIDHGQAGTEVDAAVGLVQYVRAQLVEDEAD